MTATATHTLVSITDLRRAQEILRPVAVRTPLLLLEGVVQFPAGVQVWLKPEMLSLRPRSKKPGWFKQ